MIIINQVINMHSLFIMKIHNYASPYCHAAELSQLPEKGVDERRLVSTLHSNS